MDVLQVCLFGKLEVKHGDHVTVNLCARKAQELFCYLLLHRERPHPRETLATILWCDSTSTQSKKYLRQALWQLQTAIRLPTEPSSTSVLLIEPDWVQVSPEADLWLDVTLFEQAFTIAQGTPGKQLDTQRAQALRDAVELYRGDLLEGWCHDWCLFERERLQNMYLAILDKLIDYTEANHDYEAGLAYGARILRHDRARERTHRRLMRLHYLCHNRTAALRQYEHCVAALTEELGVQPARSTMALYEQIRADQLDTSFALARTDATPEMMASTLHELLGHIEQLQTVLARTHNQIQQNIQAVEPTLVDQH
jgi:DNA-binding SARP family transcriptional activator